MVMCSLTLDVYCVQMMARIEVECKEMEEKFQSMDKVQNIFITASLSISRGARSHTHTFYAIHFILSRVYDRHHHVAGEFSLKGRPVYPQVTKC